MATVAAEAGRVEQRESVAAKIKDAEGKRVVLHYNEHRGVPTDCFGETQYYVDDVRVMAP